MASARARLCSKECSKQFVTYDCCFTLLQTKLKGSNVTEFQLSNLCFIIFHRLRETEFLLGKLYFANCRILNVTHFQTCVLFVLVSHGFSLKNAVQTVVTDARRDSTVSVAVTQMYSCILRLLFGHRNCARISELNSLNLLHGLPL